MQTQQEQQHQHYAGRLPCGSENAVTIRKNGIRHTRRLADGSEEEILSVGLACSECFSGQNLYRVLKPGFDYEMKVMEDLMMNGTDGSSSPLSLHTSGGVTPVLSDFLKALEPHLPWKKSGELDWCVSLQLEGASAVWAAIDMLLQVEMLSFTAAAPGKNFERTMVAVGGTSYHGPPSTSFGSASPLWRKPNQITYPVPKAGELIDDEALIGQFNSFLDTHAHKIGVILFEPQWGSSQAGMPWPKELLKRYIELARSRGIKIICDEIMCGLGRHGQGTLFSSEAWDLNPDAVTFGKAIGAGVYPLSGAILKHGRSILKANKCTVMQSHTYAGSSVRALMAATEVLKEIPKWLPSVTKLGVEMSHIMKYINHCADGMITCHGQGLMWGGVFSRDGMAQDENFRANMVEAFKKHCQEQKILPYFVPVGGFMVSPVIDIDVGSIYEVAERLLKVIMLTKEQVGWKQPKEVAAVTDNMSDAQRLKKYVGILGSSERCLPVLHATKSCTSCSSFVCETVRTRFLNV